MRIPSTTWPSCGVIPENLPCIPRNGCPGTTAKISKPPRTSHKDFSSLPEGNRGTQGTPSRLGGIAVKIAHLRFSRRTWSRSGAASRAPRFDAHQFTDRPRRSAPRIHPGRPGSERVASSPPSALSPWPLARPPQTFCTLAGRTRLYHNRLRSEKIERKLKSRLRIHDVPPCVVQGWVYLTP